MTILINKNVRCSKCALTRRSDVKTKDAVGCALFINDIPKNKWDKPRRCLGFMRDRATGMSIDELADIARHQYNSAIAARNAKYAFWGILATLLLGVLNYIKD